MTNHPSVWAVVPVFNRCEKTLNFLKCFSRLSYPNKKAVITDDASPDNTAYNIKLNYPDVPVIEGSGNLWWAGGTNRAIDYALKNNADYILTINDDGVFGESLLDGMMNAARKNPKYIVGCRLMRENDRGLIWSLGSSFDETGKGLFKLNHENQSWDAIKHKIPNPYPVDFMPGNGVLIPREVFEKIGRYHERLLPQYHADSDFIIRAKRAGFIPVIATDCVIYNHIITEPLVKTKLDVFFSKKSDVFLQAALVILIKYFPARKIIPVLWNTYWRFLKPGWLKFLQRKWRERKTGRRPLKSKK